MASTEPLPYPLPHQGGGIFMIPPLTPPPHHFPRPRDPSFTSYFWRPLIPPTLSYTLGACFEALSEPPLLVFAPSPRGSSLINRDPRSVLARALGVYLARRCVFPPPAYPLLATAFFGRLSSTPAHSTLITAESRVLSLPFSHPTRLRASRALYSLLPSTLTPPTPPTEPVSGDSR